MLDNPTIDKEETRNYRIWSYSLKIKCLWIYVRMWLNKEKKSKNYKFDIFRYFIVALSEMFWEWEKTRGIVGISNSMLLVFCPFAHSHCTPKIPNTHEYSQTVKKNPNDYNNSFQD